MADEELQTTPPYSQLLDASPDGVLAFDRECRYTAWNSQMERISGLGREQVLGRVAFELFPFLVETGEARYFRDALEGRSVVSVATPYAIPESGRRGFFDGYYAPLYDGAGRVVGGVSIVRDITERVEAEQALRQSEERYRAFIANSSEGIWRCELGRPVPTSLTADEQIDLFYRDGYLAECNDSMARMYGYARAEEIAGARLADLLVRDDPANVEYLRAFVSSGYRLTEIESVERDREGNLKYFSNSLVGAVEGGHVVRAWGTQRDVTASRLAENAMRESEERVRLSEERYRSLLENANDIIYSHDLEGNYLSINRAGSEITGYTREEILGGLNIAQVVAPEHLPRAKEMTRRKLDDPSPTVYELDIVTRDGRRLTLEVSTRISYRGGRPVAVEGVARDVTERKRAEAERELLLAREQSARRQAEEANRVKDEFLATLSHELRTPLTAIIGWANMLKGSHLDEATARRAVETIERNALAQKRLVEDVLDMSRVVTGKLSMEHVAVDLLDVVQSALDSVRPAAEAKRVALRCSFDPAAGTIMGDQARLQQVVWNLLANAVKFTPEGGVVKLVVERLPAQVRVTVADTGRGIAPEFLPHVFDRFRQADGSTTRRHGGLGLGLSIVHHLVEAHGGSVHAYSAGEGQGASFTVELPLPAGSQHLERGETGDVQPPAAGVGGVGAPSDEAPPALFGVRVLMVEDDPDTLEMIKLILQKNGAEVTAAPSAEGALEELSRAVPDVIVSDIGMAEVDGYELLRRVRSLRPEAGGGVPAVALTAYAGEADRARAARAGFQQHLAKPVEPDALVAAVAKLTVGARADT